MIATLWAGSLWAIGYLAAPTLFATLYDRVLAGTIAGSLFRVESWLSVICGIVLLILQKAHNRHLQPSERQGVGLIVAMLACTVIGYFCLQPFMAELRIAAGSGGVMASDATLRFAVLHGLSSTFYLIESLLGAVLILKMR